MKVFIIGVMKEGNNKIYILLNWNLFLASEDSHAILK